MVITSRRNPRILAAAKLRDRQERRRRGCFLLDGARELLQALAAGAELVEVFVCPERCRTEHASQALAALERRGIRPWETTPEVLAHLAYGEREEGLVAVAATPRRRLDDLPLPTGPPLVVVLERAEKPGNVGAILRTADAAGASAVVVADPRTDLYNPNVVRASLGAIFTVPVAAATVEETQAWLARLRCRVFAARVDGSVSAWKADFAGPAALVFGSEAEGLSEAWSGPEVVAVSLPMRGRIDSLNLSTSAAILLYEAVRQRTSG